VASFFMEKAGEARKSKMQHAGGMLRATA